jgi:hypothetical protein
MVVMEFSSLAGGETRLRDMLGRAGLRPRLTCFAIYERVAVEKKRFSHRVK